MRIAIKRTEIRLHDKVEIYRIRDKFETVYKGKVLTVAHHPNISEISFLDGAYPISISSPPYALGEINRYQVFLTDRVFDHPAEPEEILSLVEIGTDQTSQWYLKARGMSYASVWYQVGRNRDTNQLEQIHTRDEYTWKDLKDRAEAQGLEIKILIWPVISTKVVDITTTRVAELVNENRRLEAQIAVLESANCVLSSCPRCKQ